MDQSANSLTELRQESGKLIANPTTLVAASNYGGTVLGEIAFIEFRFLPRYRPITAEEWGGAVADVVNLGDSAAVAGVLRGNDSDAISTIFPNTAAGGSRGRSVKGQANGTIRAGSLLSDRSVKLLFAPDDSEHGTHVILYRAIPSVATAASMGLYLGREKGIPFSFYAVPVEDSARSVYQLALRENLTLSPS